MGQSPVGSADLLVALERPWYCCCQAAWAWMTESWQLDGAEVVGEVEVEAGDEAEVGSEDEAEVGIPGEVEDGLG